MKVDSEDVDLNDNILNDRKFDSIADITCSLTLDQTKTTKIPYKEDTSFVIWPRLNGHNLPKAHIFN